MKKFNPSSAHPSRAVQAWQILVGMAKNRQTVTYQGLSLIMYRRMAAGVLDKILGHIAFYCIDHDLPPLTSIVVGKSRGRPGSEIPVNLQNIDRNREDVYKCDWYDIYPPSASQLGNSYKRAREKK